MQHDVIALRLDDSRQTLMRGEQQKAHYPRLKLHAAWVGLGIKELSDKSGCSRSPIDRMVNGTGASLKYVSTVFQEIEKRWTASLAREYGPLVRTDEIYGNTVEIPSSPVRSSEKLLFPRAEGLRNTLSLTLDAVARQAGIHRAIIRKMERSEPEQADDVRKLFAFYKRVLSQELDEGVELVAVPSATAAKRLKEDA
jgi:hypothetical protein